MKIINHQLYKRENQPYSFVASPNFYDEEIQHKFLVMHFTHLPDVKTAINYLTDPKKEISAHLIIARDGSITQLVPFNRKAWHAGESTWKGYQKLNHYSIGIELDNGGKLERRGDKWVSWLGVEYEDSQVIVATHKNEVEPAGWQIFPKIQVDTAAAVARLLVNRYQLIDIIGHDDIAPGRKFDPGPAFPMEIFWRQVMEG